jgi:hypothetical protein
MQSVEYKDYLNKWFIDGDITLNKRNTDTNLRDALMLLGLQHYPMDQVKQALKTFMPRVSKVDKAQIRYYHNSTDYLRDKESRTRPGRAALKMFPCLNQSEVDGFTAWYNRVIVEGNQNWKLVVGNTREHYIKSFVDIGKSTNQAYDYKDMHNSCMRYKFEHLPDHPAAAYETEDFEVWYVVGEDNKVYARALVRIKGKEKYYYTTYGCNSSAVGVLWQSLKSADVFNSRSEFDGARLKIIYSYNPFYKEYTCAIPYVDAVRAFYVDKENGYFVLDDTGDGQYTPSDGGFCFGEYALDFLRNKSKVDYSVQPTYSQRTPF